MARGHVGRAGWSGVVWTSLLAVVLAGCAGHRLPSMLDTFKDDNLHADQNPYDAYVKIRTAALDLMDRYDNRSGFNRSTGLPMLP